jgi:hypothetical protein
MKKLSLETWAIIGVLAMKRIWKVYCVWATPKHTILVILLELAAFLIACAIVWNLTSLDDYRRLWK